MTLEICTAHTYAEDEDPRVAESGTIIILQKKNSIETLFTKGWLNHTETYGHWHFDGKVHFHLRYATDEEIANRDPNDGEVVQNPEEYLRYILRCCENKNLRDKITERFL